VVHMGPVCMSYRLSFRGDQKSQIWSRRMG
jgi:hypothetical protein